jgi:hypothetical protein
MDNTEKKQLPLDNILKDLSDLLRSIDEQSKKEKDEQSQDKKAKGGLAKNKKKYSGELRANSNIEKEIRQQPSLRETLINQYRKRLKDGGNSSKEDEESLKEVIRALTGQLSLQPSEYELLDKLLNELKEKYGSKQ